MTHFCRLILAILLLSVSGCFAPVYRTEFPSIRGKIQCNGTPIANTLVYLDRYYIPGRISDFDCGSEKSLTQDTDKSGRFKFPGKYKFGYYMGPKIFSSRCSANFRICVRDVKEVWHSQSFGMSGKCAGMTDRKINCDFCPLEKGNQKLVCKKEKIVTTIDD